MELLFSKHDIKNAIDQTFYTEEEQQLLEQLENGLIKTHSHEEVMKSLRQALNLSHSE